MKLYQVNILDYGKQYKTLFVYGVGLDSVEGRVKRYLQEYHPFFCRPATTLEMNEIDPKKILSIKDKKPKAIKKTRHDD